MASYGSASNNPVVDLAMIHRSLLDEMIFETGSGDSISVAVLSNQDKSALITYLDLALNWTDFFFANYTFVNEPKNFLDLSGSVLCYRGFSSRFWVVLGCFG
ncbi:hypothetical protein ACH5RR_029219 [Cinchona calisaya]|uniref:Uncharacterized protein n=1 Tax=Cinchona calisaya TaxID=153742 RepID=A0ABD2YR36_9GENT